MTISLFLLIYGPDLLSTKRRRIYHDVPTIPVSFLMDYLSSFFVSLGKTTKFLHRQQNCLVLSKTIQSVGAPTRKRELGNSSSALWSYFGNSRTSVGVLERDCDEKSVSAEKRRDQFSSVRLFYGLL